MVTNSARIPVTGRSFLAAMFMTLSVIDGFGTASALARCTSCSRSGTDCDRTRVVVWTSELAGGI